MAGAVTIGRTRAQLVGRLAIALIVLCNLGYLVGMTLLPFFPTGNSIVNVGLRIGPIWAPVIVFWVAAALARSRRVPIVLAAIAVTAWASGDAAYNALMGATGVVLSPAPTDIGYLLFYVFMIAAFVALSIPGARRALVPAILEGAMASFGTASVLLLLIQPVLDTAVDGAVDGPLSFGLVLSLAYPLLDVALLAMTVAYAVNTGLIGARRTWWFIAGIGVFVATDLAYAFLTQVDGYHAGTFIDLGWPIGLSFLSWWALGFIEPERAPSGNRSITLLGVIAPIVATLAALGVLFYATQRPVHIAAIIAAGLTAVLAAIPILTRQTLLSRLVEGQDRLLAEMRELDKSKTEMMATLNHEMRTPLTSVLGYLELVRDGEGGTVPPKADEMLGAVEHSARRLHSIVDEMLLLTRLDSHGLDVQMEVLDAALLVSHVVEQLAPVAEGRQVELRFEVNSVASVVLADRTRLEHALTTIVENAIKFTPNGGSVVVSLTERPHTRPTVITVTDTGMGVPPDDLPHLFERFYRASNALQSVVTGSGLGLAIAKGIVELHGGRIRAESTLGEGTTMIVSLPAAI